MTKYLPRITMPVVGFINPFLTFVGFLLLLLVSLSIPIIKTISILDIKGKHRWTFVGPNASVDVKIGVWGYCASELKVSIVWIKLLSQHNYCTPVQLGYKLNDRLLKILKIYQHRGKILRGMIIVIGLHPIACGLAFLAFLFTLVLSCRPRRLTSVMALVFSALAAIAATLVLLIDVSIITIAERKVREATHGNLEVMGGSAPLLILGSMVALWASVVGVAYSTFRVYKRLKVERKPAQFRREQTGEAHELEPFIQV
ncbi:unnamed protein product [Rhizoctonia solani]|uniref:Uncharacterized protein n=1 Tax=Rhizoctonia solani TaxID=456999 RepID=A0A8H2X248_9AGAM|nr:unnamed protein product [Rhizoctonia solani]